MSWGLKACTLTWETGSASIAMLFLTEKNCRSDIINPGNNVNHFSPKPPEMERTLVLIRHAKSDWGNPGQADFDRPLNARGKKNAPEMGKRLQQKQVIPDLIISSPAMRAATTA